MDRDSIANTFIVSIVLCLVCAFLVSAVAVSLRPAQQANLAGFKKSKVLEVAGFSQADIEKAGGVNELYAKRIGEKIINLESGEEDIEGVKEAMKKAKKDLGDKPLDTYDQIWAAKSKNENAANQLPSDKKIDPAGLKWREKFSHVYILKGEDGKSVEKYIFPIRGNGLWGTMMGFVSVKPDLVTVDGLTYYAHKETPGLGGEVDRPSWKELWKGKLIFGEGDDVKLEVIKGAAKAGSKYEIDGLSGATITSNGVTAMIKYWFGKDGFGPFIKKQKSKGAESTSKSLQNRDNKKVSVKISTTTLLTCGGIDV